MKDQLVGTWTVVSAEIVRPNGTRSAIFGPNPRGIMILDTGGRFSQQIVSPERPRFAANNRLKGTAEENQAAVHGTIGNFGTWSVDEGGNLLIFRVEGSTFPNSEGETQKRPVVSLTADELAYRTAGTIGAAVEARWKRAR